jgi:hypothetical protein
MTANLPAKLDALAKDIRDVLDRADKSQRRADDLRLTAGQMLLAARQQVAVQKLIWSEWLQVNIPDRSERDVRRLIAIAKAPDPAAAAEEARAKTREQVAETRQRQQLAEPDIRMSAAGEATTEDPTAPRDDTEAAAAINALFDKADAATKDPAVAQELRREETAEELDAWVATFNSWSEDRRLEALTRIGAQPADPPASGSAPSEPIAQHDAQPQPEEPLPPAAQPPVGPPDDELNRTLQKFKRPTKPVNRAPKTEDPWVTEFYRQAATAPEEPAPQPEPVAQPAPLPEPIAQHDAQPEPATAPDRADMPASEPQPETARHRDGTVPAAIPPVDPEPVDQVEQLVRRFREFSSDGRRQHCLKGFKNFNEAFDLIASNPAWQAEADWLTAVVDLNADKLAELRAKVSS